MTTTTSTTRVRRKDHNNNNNHNHNHNNDDDDELLLLLLLHYYSYFYLLLLKLLYTATTTTTTTTTTYSYMGDPSTSHVATRILNVWHIYKTYIYTQTPTNHSHNINPKTSKTQPRHSLSPSRKKCTTEMTSMKVGVNSTHLFSALAVEG